MRASRINPLRAGRAAIVRRPAAPAPDLNSTVHAAIESLRQEMTEVQAELTRLRSEVQDLRSLLG